MKVTSTEWFLKRLPSCISTYSNLKTFLSNKKMADGCSFHNVDKWIETNKHFFRPPVGNKLMHNRQLKVFYVGGPNSRQDYHLEEGEELFYMCKGNMCLKVLANNKFQNIIIKEGEMFLLPRRIFHSPQRSSGTVGLVIERERLPNESDCLRYFVEKSKEILFERWFHCDDLGSQLQPIIEEFFSSEQFITGRPNSTSFSTATPPIEQDNTRKLELPINLKGWLNSNRAEIQITGGWKRIYSTNYETDVIVYGKGQRKGYLDAADLFLWQLEGSCKVTSSNNTYLLANQNDTLLIPKGTRYIMEGDRDCLCLAVLMDARKKDRTADR